MLCDDLGDAVLRRSPELLEIVEHLRTRIGAYRDATALRELQRAAIERSNAGRTARAGLAGVLEDEHVGSMQCEQRVDVLEAARRSVRSDESPVCPSRPVRPSAGAVRTQTPSFENRSRAPAWAVFAMSYSGGVLSTVGAFDGGFMSHRLERQRAEF